MEFSGAILAAGRGERLRSGTEPLPKPLVEVGGEPMLARQARAMLAAGARDVTAVINAETAAFARRRGVEFPRELKIVVRDTANSLETLFALGETLASGPFLLATVDAVVPPPEFTRFAREAVALMAAGAVGGFDGALALVRWRGDQRALFAHVTESRLITELSERESTLVTAGIYFLPSRVFAFAAKARERRLDALRRFLAMLIAEGTRLGAIEVAGAIDVDEPGDLEDARAAAGGFAKEIDR